MNAGPAKGDESRISDADRQVFERDGVVCLRGLIDQAWIDALSVSIASVAAKSGPRARRRVNERDGIFIIQGGAGEVDSCIRRFSLQSAAGRAAAQIMRSSTLRVFNEVIFVKNPGAGTTEWHNDYSYMNLQGDKVCTVWIALDHVSAETGAMFFVRGSHRERLLHRPILLGTGREQDTGQPRPRVPNFWDVANERDLVCYDLAPGDCTLHHGWTLHGAGPNCSPTAQRRGLAIRYIGDDVNVEPSFYGIRSSGNISNGEPVSDAVRFPEVAMD